jgi:hypothetical protein
MFGILHGNHHYSIGHEVLDESVDSPTSSDLEYEDPVRSCDIPLPSIESSHLPASPASHHVSNSTQMAEPSTASPGSLPVSGSTDDLTSATGSAQESSGTTTPSVPTQWPPSDLRLERGESAEAGPSSCNVIDPQPSQALRAGLKIEMEMSNTQGLSENQTQGSLISDLNSQIRDAQLLVHLKANPRPNPQQTQPPLERCPLSEESLPPVALYSRGTLLPNEPDRNIEAIPDSSSHAGVVDNYVVYYPGRKSNADGNEKGKGKERMLNETEVQYLHKAADRKEPLAPVSEGMHAPIGDARVALADFGTGTLTAVHNNFLTLKTNTPESSLVAIVRHSDSFPGSNLRADHGKGKLKAIMGTIDIQGDPESAEEIEEPPAQFQNETLVGRQDSMAVNEAIELNYSTAAEKYPLIRPVMAEPFAVDHQNQLETEVFEIELSSTEGNESQVTDLEDGMATMEDVKPEFPTTGGKFPCLRPNIAEPVSVYPQSQMNTGDAEIDIYGMGDSEEPLARAQDSIATMEGVEAESSTTTDNALTREAIISGPTAILVQNPSQSPTDMQMSDLVSQFSELTTQISNQSSMLESVIEVDDVSDQMAIDYAGGGITDAVDVAARAATVAAWCGILDGDGDANVNGDRDGDGDDEEENEENWGS